MIRYLLALAMLAGCARTVPAPPEPELAPPWERMPKFFGPRPDDSPVMQVARADTSLWKYDSTHHLVIAPLPDTVAIHILHASGPIPAMFRGTSAAVAPNYDAAPEFERRMYYAGQAPLRLVVFSDSTASIERHDGGRWTTLRMR